ncbi:MAG: hypothetical protein LQ352_006563 [Teloschistes flavicans]|nr:MAG: hypothetical protein LQ352_006563 [Teloschistes flavicans]
MSAADLGARLLQEVKVEGLDEFLQTLRSGYETQRPRAESKYTGQATIDGILNAFIRPEPYYPHSIFTLATATVATSDQHRVGRSNQAPALELVGAFPCSGKKQLLYYLVAQLLLPLEHENVVLRGRGSAVVLLDLGNTFSLLRLKHVMIGYVCSCIDDRSGPLSIENIGALMRASFEHLHVFRPQSSLSLLGTLSNLQSYLFDTSSHVSANRALGAIVVNDVDAFLWQARLEDAEDEILANNAAPKSGSLTSQFRELVAQLRQLQSIFSCLVIATSSALSSLTYSRVDGLHVPILQSHMPAAWKAFVTARLIVKRGTVQKFQYGMSVEEAAKEAQQRQEAVEKSAFSARLDWSESEAWREDTRNTIKAMGVNTDLIFKVAADSVDLNVDD